MKRLDIGYTDVAAQIYVNESNLKEKKITTRAYKLRKNRLLKQLTRHMKYQQKYLNVGNWKITDVDNFFEKAYNELAKIYGLRLNDVIENVLIKNKKINSSLFDIELKLRGGNYDNKRKNRKNRN